jgi:hypothetical protein
MIVYTIKRKKKGKQIYFISVSPTRLSYGYLCEATFFDGKDVAEWMLSTIPTKIRKALEIIKVNITEVAE